MQRSTDQKIVGSPVIVRGRRPRSNPRRCQPKPAVLQAIKTPRGARLVLRWPDGRLTEIELSDEARAELRYVATDYIASPEFIQKRRGVR